MDDAEILEMDTFKMQRENEELTQFVAEVAILATSLKESI